jgi:enediyne biosynthesis protein E5
MAFAAKQWDARYFQMVFQLIFLCYGIMFLHWQAEWVNYVLFIGTGLLFQYCCDAVVLKKLLHPSSWLKNGCWKSVLISTFSLCLLLKTNSWAVCVLASSITIISKYIFRFNGKHVFNPSALGIAATVFLTGNAWISPGQWGSNAVLFFGIICLGCIVVTRVQKLDISLAFILTFAILLFARQIIYLGWPVDFFIQSVSTGSLLLFSFFMITDPRTTPNHPVARVVWAMAVAAVAFYLTTFKFVNGAPIWVLLCAQPLVPVMDYFFKAKSFQWKPPSPKEGQTQFPFFNIKTIINNVS